MFKIAVGRYTMGVESGTLPSIYEEYRRRAVLSEEFDVRNPERKHCFISVARDLEWPRLVVAQTFSPSVAGFDPCVLLVPETDVLFIGAGERLLAYHLDPVMRLWEDKCDTGFWHWMQHGKYVLMSAELELAAWDSMGNKLWSTFVEPPWEYGVEDGLVKLDAMGRKTEFGLGTGPEQF
jgi:hypothetical protein